MELINILTIIGTVFPLGLAAYTVFLSIKGTRARNKRWAEERLRGDFMVYMMRFYDYTFEDYINDSIYEYVKEKSPTKKLPHYDIYGNITHYAIDPYQIRIKTEKLLDYLNLKIYV